VIPMMEWIDDKVAVGGRLDAFLLGRLRTNAIDLIIDARVFFDKDYGDKQPLLDKIKRAVDALILLTEREQKVLVRCNRGRDRSPFMAMIYISKKYGKSYREAYELVKEKRPRTVYHWDWVERLEKD
jgi:hypothetical protein